MNYKKKYLKYKKKYLMTKKINGGYFDRPLHNDINNEIDVYISIKYIKSTIFSAFLNYLNGTDDYKINGKKLFLLKKKIKEIKKKNFNIKKNKKKKNKNKKKKKKKEKKNNNKK